MSYGELPGNWLSDTIKVARELYPSDHVAQQQHVANAILQHIGIYLPEAFRRADRQAQRFAENPKLCAPAPEIHAAEFLLESLDLMSVEPRLITHPAG